MWENLPPFIFLIKKLTKILIALFLLPVLLVSTIGCGFILQNSGPIPISITTSSFLIAWDSDGETISDLPSGTSYFNLYYRELFSKDWIFLKSTIRNRNKVVVGISELGRNGNYEFGIEQVDNNGHSSEIHGSTDFSANPVGGWYLNLSD